MLLITNEMQEGKKEGVLCLLVTVSPTAPQFLLHGSPPLPFMHLAKISRTFWGGRVTLLTTWLFVLKGLLSSWLGASQTQPWPIFTQIESPRAKT